MTSEQVDQLVAKAKEGWNGRTLPWAKLAKACDISVSYSNYVYV